MAAGLPISDIVRVTTSLTPVAAPTRNFGAGLHIGAAPTIDTNERLRVYPNMQAVSADFPNTSNEWKAALRHFAQSPQPAILYIGRWARTDTKATLRGGVLSGLERLITNFTAISTGSLMISVDGTPKTLTGLDFTQQTNLNGVAAVIDTALTGASVLWNANIGRFEVTSDSAGASSVLTYATPAGSGTDISSLLKLRSGQASAPVAGIVAETLVSAVSALIDRSGDWYAAILTELGVDTASVLAAAQLIEAQDKKRLFGVTITDTAAIDPTAATDLGTVLRAANLRRTFVQYSTTDPYAVASFFGRAATIDFSGENTTITMKFKLEPGVTAETLTESQWRTLRAKNINAFVNYDNATANLQDGTMMDGSWFDEVQGLDWLENDVQTAVYNLFRTYGKIPQTDAGNNIISTCIKSRLQQGVTNGLLAPGLWTGAGFGSLKPNTVLDAGYYVYVAPIVTQSQADREARKGMPQQVALKGAGAIHDATVLMTFNR